MIAALPSRSRVRGLGSDLGGERGSVFGVRIEERFPFLAELSASASQAVESALVRQRVGPRTRLIERDDYVSGVYLVEQGALRVFYLTPEGREGTLYWVDPGQSCILGLNCIFGEVAYPAWVESDTETTRFAKIPGRLYRDLFSTEAAVQRFTFEVMSARTFELMALLTEARSLGLEQRVASFLLKRRDGADEVRMSQETIANHIGTAREVVSRVVRMLAAEGLIETRRGVIRVLKEAELRALA